jgi:hypothetical protein
LSVLTSGRAYRRRPSGSEQAITGVCYRVIARDPRVHASRKLMIRSRRSDIHPTQEWHSSEADTKNLGLILRP